MLGLKVGYFCWIDKSHTIKSLEVANAPDKRGNRLLQFVSMALHPVLSLFWAVFSLVPPQHRVPAGPGAAAEEVTKMLLPKLLRTCWGAAWDTKYVRWGRLTESLLMMVMLLCLFNLTHLPPFQSITRKSLPATKRRTASVVIKKINTPGQPSMLFDDGDTPRHILKNILLTGECMGLPAFTHHAAAVCCPSNHVMFHVIQSLWDPLWFMRELKQESHSRPQPAPALAANVQG